MNPIKYLKDQGPLPWLLLVFGFGTLIFMFGSNGLPGGFLFGLALLWIVAVFLGARVGELGLPPLVGMLMAGFILRNLASIVSTGIEDSYTFNKAAGLLKGVALAIIMLRAGFGLDLQKLKQNALLMTILSFVPAMMEATTIALLSRVLVGFPLAWGYLLGFVIADVSPAVTVPLLLDFQLQGYGTDKGIPTILLAGSGFNSVFAICAYGVAWSFIFSGGLSPTIIVILAFVEILGGIVAGILIGKILALSWKVAGATDTRRFILTLLSACLCIFGGGYIGRGGGGTLAVVVIGIFLNESLHEAARPVQNLLNFVWGTVGQPYLFGLLGAAVSLSALTPSLVSAGLLLIIGGLIIRAGTCYLCTLTTDWNFKEKLFTALTWCPKATVQAALSTVALDYVKDSSNRNDFDDDHGNLDFDRLKRYATVVLTVAVLSIIVTAPLFAVIMKWTGENWLVHTPPDQGLEGDDEFITMEVKLGSVKESRTASLGPRKFTQVFMPTLYEQEEKEVESRRRSFSAPARPSEHSKRTEMTNLSTFADPIPEDDVAKGLPL